MIPIYVGYDPKEPVAFHTCTSSIIRNTTQPISINPLALNLLSNLYKEIHTDGSNTFTYTRFLVPFLMNYSGFAIFIDGDMILLEDISELWDLKSNDFAVQVVKHNYKTKANIKYLNQQNSDYPRKNWSSVIIWNCSHIKNKFLTPTSVSKLTGADLHRFSWLDESDIGELPIEWNWLCDEYGENSNAKLLHYTLGIPNFKEYSTTVYSDLWNEEKANITFCKQND